MSDSATNSTEVANAREISIQSRGLTLKALTFGVAARPPILAIHGWMDNAATFASLAPLLDQFYVVALELPGHGKSEHRPYGSSYFHADYALDIVHAANDLQLDSFVLMGHSMGGGVATLVAAAVPERVEHLILLDGLGPYTGSASSTSSQLGKAIAHSVLPVSAPRRYRSFDALLARRSAASSEIDPGALALIVRRNAEQLEDTNETYWQWATDPRLKLASPTRLTNEAVMHVLSDIKAPVLNLLASTGIMSQHLDIAGRKAQLKNAKTITIDGHHHFHLDGGAAQTAELITDFVATTPPYAGES